MYPRDTKDTSKPGRLRLMYEANPMAMIVEQAGGAASTGRERVLDIAPTTLHQRVPLILGSRAEVERLIAYHKYYDEGEEPTFETPLFHKRSLFRSAEGIRGHAVSAKHPIIAITGSSGAGTTTVKTTFQQIFRREGVAAAIIEGDAFHRYDRTEMRAKMAGRRSSETRTSVILAQTQICSRNSKLFFVTTAKRGLEKRGNISTTKRRRYFTSRSLAHSQHGKTSHQAHLLFYEGLHGAVKTDKVDVARHADLLIGVVPIINLEWIQKLHRDRDARGQSQEAILDTILRRMPDFVKYICPQFSETHVNFQRVPTVDTSNPFISRDIPSADESMLIIRFRSPKDIDFPYLLSMLHDSFMSRANTIVCPGGKMALAMQLIFTPMIWQLMDRKRKAF